MKTALISGVSGQDGAYLADLLLKQGYSVYGTSRDAQMSSFSNLSRKTTHCAGSTMHSKTEYCTRCP